MGSGFTCHTLRRFNAAAQAPAAAFDAWRRHTLLDLAPDARKTALPEWDKAPAARLCHPREDHLIPLMVAMGAVGAVTGGSGPAGTPHAQNVAALSTKRTERPGITTRSLLSAVARRWVSSVRFWPTMDSSMPGWLLNGRNATLTLRLL